MVNSIFKFLLAGLVALSTVACANSNGEVRIARSSALAANGTQSTSPGAACGSAAGVVGRVFDDASMSSYGSFETRVKSLISADYDPQYIGTVVGVNGPSATCVTLEGGVKFDSSGQLVLDQTTLRMKVYDSLTGTLDTSGQPAGAYPIEFAAASEGRKESSGSFYAVFSDKLGSVTLRGQISNAQITGTIEYANLQSYNGGVGASGVLGKFAINASSFLK